MSRKEPKKYVVNWKNYVPCDICGVARGEQCVDTRPNMNRNPKTVPHEGRLASYTEQIESAIAKWREWKARQLAVTTKMQHPICEKDWIKQKVKTGDDGKPTYPTPFQYHNSPPEKCCYCGKLTIWGVYNLSEHKPAHCNCEETWNSQEENHPSNLLVR